MRTNLLNQKQGGISQTAVLPAFGINYNPNNKITAFFGFHGGFAPPRVEDAISNNGNTIEVQAERSWNYELGVRTKPSLGAQLDTTLFHADFQNQNAVGSIAGGNTPIASGKALYEGIELLARQNFDVLLNTDHNVYVQAAYTWVGNAQMQSAFNCLAVDGTVPTSGCTSGFVNGTFIGNRMPYSPEHTLTATVGYSHPNGFDAHLETVFVGEQFSDFANTVDAPVNGNGQIGKIADYVVVNFATTYHVKAIHTDFFAQLKNMFDEDYVVDRTRGILPGAPRLVQAGFKVAF
jgi:Fe(3+) dicitrate transport protein